MVTACCIASHAEQRQWCLCRAGRRNGLLQGRRTYLFRNLLEKLRLTSFQKAHPSLWVRALCSGGTWDCWNLCCTNSSTGLQMVLLYSLRDVDKLYFSFTKLLSKNETRRGNILGTNTWNFFSQRWNFSGMLTVPLPHSLPSNSRH